MRYEVTHDTLFHDWLYSTDEQRTAIETTAQTLYSLGYWRCFEYHKFLYHIRDYKKSRRSAQTVGVQ